MTRKKKKNEFYCTECGYIQKPTKENDKWETYSPICQKCGENTVTIRIVEVENGRRNNN